MRKKYLLLALVATVSLVLDQATKVWIRNNLPIGGRPIEVIDNYFHIVHAENTGAAWGLLREAEWRIPFFVVTTLIAVGVILYYYYRLDNDDTLQGTGLALILGGALGNFIDRVTYQSVTDFIEIYAGTDPLRSFFIDKFHSNRWPAFNIADAAIVVGIGIILYYIFVVEPRMEKAREVHPDGAEAVVPGGN